MKITPYFSPQFRHHGRHINPEYLVSVSLRKASRVVETEDLHGQVVINNTLRVASREAQRRCIR